MQGVQLLKRTGERAIAALDGLGAMVLFFARVCAAGWHPPLRLRLLFEQLEFVGVGSIFIIVLTGFFTGAVFTLQSVDAFSRVGMESMVGSTVMLAVCRELAPVLTSLMVTGRVASAFATEIGTMRVTEQIDAMEVMAVDPIHYLIVPRVVSLGIMVPALTVVFLSVAAVGSYVVAVIGLGLDEGAYMSRIEWMLDPYDFAQGVAKSLVFGLVIGVIGCFKGFHADGGARGVGVATTEAVVIGSISVFLLDYVLTTVLLLWAPQ